MTLTKAQVVESIQNQIGLPKNRSLQTVETLLEIIKRTLATGEDMMLAPRKVVTFKCSGKLRDRVNG